MASKFIGLRISEDEEVLLNELVEATKKTKSGIIREAISQYLEDASDYIEGLKVLNSNKKRYSLEEAEQLLKG